MRTVGPEKDCFYQNSEYEVHKVGPKYLASRNFSFSVLKGKAVGLALRFVGTIQLKPEEILA
jgi:hypothetical protein